VSALSSKRSAILIPPAEVKTRLRAMLAVAGPGIDQARMQDKLRSVITQAAENRLILACAKAFFPTERWEVCGHRTDQGGL
jgi:hypothetical protein